MNAIAPDRDARRIVPIRPSRTVEITEIEVRERLNGAERAWLRACLKTKRGVVDALYAGTDAYRLVVAHDVRQLSQTELLDFLVRCGVCVEPAAERFG